MWHAAGSIPARQDCVALVPLRASKELVFIPSASALPLYFPTVLAPWRLGSGGANNSVARGGRNYYNLISF